MDKARIRTKLGTVVVEEGEDGLVVGIMPVAGAKVWTEGDVLRATTRKVPAVGDELTKDGRTFEVTAVRMDGDRVQVKGDHGYWTEV